MTLRLRLLAAPAIGVAARPRRVNADVAGWPAVRGPGPECALAASAAGLADPPVDAELCDWDLGRWTGLDLDVLAAQEPQLVSAWLDDETFDGHGGESLAVLIERTRGWLDSTAARHSGRLLAVAPVAVARAAVCVTAGTAPQAFWRMDVEPLAVVEVTVRGDRRALRWSAS
ncbi:histidine phosphatase family protein [Angustibacter sp. McL0619]|uniref:histidine phosphatase family protein n=1 Tax=Angustibacter sp. McL0619 TaxID=3415676 RepID=UPI003CED0E8B